MMFGKAISVGERNPCGAGEVTVSLRNLSVEDYRLKVRDVNLDVHCGEVIGLAGMEGSGQGLFLRAVAGMVRTVGGKILINDHDLTGRSYQIFKKHGVAFLPASRLEEGLVPGLNLTEHFILAEEAKGFFINWEKGRLLAQKRITDFNVRGTPANTVEVAFGRQPAAGFAGPAAGAAVTCCCSNTRRAAWISSRPFTSGASSRNAASRAPRSCSSPPTWKRSCNTVTGCWSFSAAR